MSNAELETAGFDLARWDHWMLIVAFVGVAALGLWSSWRSHRAAKRRRQRSRMNYLSGSVAQAYAARLYPMRSLNGRPCRVGDAVPTTASALGSVESRRSRSVSERPMPLPGAAWYGESGQAVPAKHLLHSPAIKLGAVQGESEACRAHYRPHMWRER